METDRKGLVNRKTIVAVLVYIGLIAICCIALYAVPSVKGMLERTYIAEHGSIDVKDEVSGFIVRDETVYIAAQDSKITRKAKEGVLYKAGTKAVKLKPENEEEEPAETEEAAEPAEGEEDEKAEKEEKEEIDAGKYTSVVKELGDAVVVTEDGKLKEAGYVIYNVTGAEAKLSTDAVDDLTQKELKNLTGRKTMKTPEKKCGKDYPVFKVVSNKKWYLVFYIDNEDADKYVPGDTVTIDLNDEQVPVTISGVVNGRKKSRITLTCKSFYDGFLDERKLDTTVTLASAEGLVLEDQSIVEGSDGRRGVFVVNKLGEHVFTPVMVKADDGVRCVVYSDIYVDADGNYVETIGTYDEIVAEPSEEDMANLEKAIKEKAEKEKAEKEKAEKEKAEKEKAKEEQPKEEPAEPVTEEPAATEEPATEATEDTDGD